MKLISHDKIIKIEDEDLSDFIVETYRRKIDNETYLFQNLIRKSSLRRAKELKAKGERFIFIPNIDYFPIQMRIPKEN